MATKPPPLPTSTARNPHHKPVEVTALLAPRPLSDGELKRVSRALAAEGLEAYGQPKSSSPRTIQRP